MAISNTQTPAYGHSHVLGILVFIVLVAKIIGESRMGCITQARRKLVLTSGDILIPQITVAIITAVAAA